MTFLENMTYFLTAYNGETIEVKRSGLRNFWEIHDGPYQDYLNFNRDMSKALDHGQNSYKRLSESSF